MTDFASLKSLEDYNRLGEGYLPGLLGLEITQVEPELFSGRIKVEQKHMAPNGFLHAATVIALADSLAGYGTVRNLPEGANGFTTIELKSNHLGTARAGYVTASVQPVHRGRSTQVWDGLVTLEETGAKIALFRCTQMILWPKG